MICIALQSKGYQVNMRDIFFDNMFCFLSLTKKKS